MMTQSDGTAMPADAEARSDFDASGATNSPDVAPNDDFLSTNELASLIHVDPSTLRRWRTAKRPAGPPFTRLSPRVVVYNIVDVRRWIALKRIDPAEGA